MGLFDSMFYATPEDALYDHALEGRARKAHELLEKGVNPNARNHAGLFPLYVAAEGGHLRIVMDLVEHGANVNKATPNNSTSLNNAAEEGHLDVVKYLLSQGADPTIKTVNGHGPEDGARHYGHYKVAEVIANHTVSKTETDTCPTRQSRHQGLLQPIIDKAGISPELDIDIDDFENALFETTTNIMTSGNMDNVSWNQIIAYTETCEHVKGEPLSARFPFIEKFGENEKFDEFVVQFLKNYSLVAGVCKKDGNRVKEALNAGAKPNTVMSRCLYRGKTITPIVQAAVIDSLEITETLIKHEANPNFTQTNGESALAVAACNGNRQLVEYLLQHNADPNIKSWAGTPLATASKPSIVKLLLENGSNPNIPDRDGDLPIIGALDQNNVEKTKLLIEFGTDLLHENHQGITAIDYAKRLRNKASKVTLEHVQRA